MTTRPFSSLDHATQQQVLNVAVETAEKAVEQVSYVETPLGQPTLNFQRVEHAGGGHIDTEPLKPQPNYAGASGPSGSHSSPGSETLLGLPGLFRKL